jgi:hypothetical protein
MLHRPLFPVFPEYLIFSITQETLQSNDECRKPAPYDEYHSKEVFYVTDNHRDFSIALTGDSFITTKISDYKEPDFIEAFDIIRSQDLGFTNLEVLLNDFKGIPAAQSGGTYAGAPTALADELKWAGFQIVARANNHSLDYSYEAFMQG